MNIGIDIDDTISQSFEQIFANSQRFDIEVVGGTGEPKNYGKIDNHNYIETMYPHWTKKHFELFWSTYFMGVLTKAKPKDYAPEIIHKLKQDGNRIILITSRYEEIEGKTIIEDATKEWLEKNKMIYDELVMNSQNKLIIAQEKKIDLFIDHRIAHCRKMQEGQIKTFLYTTTCNQGCEVPDLERVYSWPQIYKKYLLIQKENS